MNQPIDVRLKERAIELPTPPMPVAHHVGAAQTGNRLFLMGQEFLPR